MVQRASLICQNKASLIDFERDRSLNDRAEFALALQRVLCAFRASSKTLLKLLPTNVGLVFDDLQSEFFAIGPGQFECFAPTFDPARAAASRTGRCRRL